MREVTAQTTNQPLRSGDPRYVDVAKGRDTNDLDMLYIHLRNAGTLEDTGTKVFTKVALTGGRGCGKTTELFKIEDKLSDEFKSLHLFVDNSLLGDCDYTDLFLWLVESLAREFEKRGMPLEEKLVSNVTDWFAETTLVEEERKKEQMNIQTEATAEGKVGLYWVKLKLLARLRSRIEGSVEQRQEIRRKLQNYSAELIDKVNLLLNNAQQILSQKTKKKLLIVQDNLDRLDENTARKLFFENGEQLKKINAHVIYTVPNAIDVAPSRIDVIFENSYIMPTVKIFDQEGKDFETGIDALIKLVNSRIDIDKVFDSTEVVRYLVKKSGGSMRDLMRLLNYAQLSAQADNKQTIDMISAKQGISKLRVDFERTLVPADVYFGVLVQVNHSKQLKVGTDDSNSINRISRYFIDLIDNGSILEYMNDSWWYDVHPIIQETKEFKNATRQL